MESDLYKQIRYEVRSSLKHDPDKELESFAQEIYTETIRYDRKTAEQDVELLAMFNKQAWIVEI